jgi:tRNA dimethylallyltransferase
VTDNRVIVIVGPTGSGKSRLAVAIAKFLNSEIINADAFQVYKEMSIGINKNSTEKMQGIVHHLHDFISIKEEWNVKLFQKMAREKIADIKSRSMIPIVCGGTGLYVNALIKDYKFIENEKEYEFSAFSNMQLWNMIRDIDEEESTKIHVNNRRRLERALTILKNSGIKKSVSDSIGQNYTYEPLIIFLNPNMKSLAIDLRKRVDSMLKEGWIEECNYIKSNFKDYEKLNAMKAIAYNDICNDIIDPEKIYKQNLNYAKKQVTWFRNKNKDKTLVFNFDKFDDNLVKDVINKIDEWVKKTWVD